MTERNDEPTREQLERLQALVLEAGSPREAGYFTINDPWGDQPTVSPVPCSVPGCTRNSTHWREGDDVPVCQEHHETA